MFNDCQLEGAFQSSALHKALNSAAQTGNEQIIGDILQYYTKRKLVVQKDHMVGALCSNGHLDLAKKYWPTLEPQQKIRLLTQLQTRENSLDGEHWATARWLLSLSAPAWDIVGAWATKICPTEHRCHKEFIQQFRAKCTNPGFSDGELQLWYRLQNYPVLLSSTNIPLLLALNDRQAAGIAQAFNKLQRTSSLLLTVDNFTRLLEKPDEAVAFARLQVCGWSVISSSSADKEFLQLLNQCSCFRSYQPIKQTGTTSELRKIYEKLSVENQVIEPITLLQGLLQLTADELTFLQEQDQPTLETIFTEENYSPVAQVIAEQTAVAKLYEEIPKTIRQTMPDPQHGENSITDSLLILARAYFAQLKQEEQLLNEKGLETVEQEIRSFLLEKMAAGFEQAKDVQKARFIRDNLPALATRSNTALNQQAEEYFTDTLSTTQTAWRAYQPDSERLSGHYANLFTAPSTAQSDATVFSTDATVRGTALQGKAVSCSMAAEDVRRLTAKAFLAMQSCSDDEKERCGLETKFIASIAEVRRAHSVDSSCKDSPSCYPGTVSRIGLFLCALPRFQSKEDNSQDLKVKLRQQVKTQAQTALLHLMQQCKTDFDRRLLLSAVQLVGRKEVSTLLTDPQGFQYGLSYTQDDLKKVLNFQGETLSTEDEQQALVLYSQQAMAKRTQWLKMTLKDFPVISSLLVDQPKINYLLARELTNSSDLLVSIPKSLLDAAASEKKPGSQSEVAENYQEKKKKNDSDNLPKQLREHLRQAIREHYNEKSQPSELTLDEQNLQHALSYTVSLVCAIRCQFMTMENNDLFLHIEDGLEKFVQQRAETYPQKDKSDETTKKEREAVYAVLTDEEAPQFLRQEVKAFFAQKGMDFVAQQHQSPQQPVEAIVEQQVHPVTVLHQDLLDTCKGKLDQLDWKEDKVYQKLQGYLRNNESRANDPDNKQYAASYFSLNFRKRYGHAKSLQEKLEAVEYVLKYYYGPSQHDSFENFIQSIPKESQYHKEALCYGSLGRSLRLAFEEKQRANKPAPATSGCFAWLGRKY